MISVLGEPEEIDGSDPEEEFEPSSAHESRYRDARKRIYRDTEGKVIGGVCSGLGEYFRIDPLIIRIIFLISFFVYGVGILIYLLLWIVIPEARTRTEKMEMRGEPINVSNIERSIRRDYSRGRKRRGKQVILLSPVGEEVRTTGSHSSLMALERFSWCFLRLSAVLLGLALL